MKKQKIYGIIAVVIFLSVTLVPLFVSVVREKIEYPNGRSFYIFSDISDCEKLEEYDGVEVKKHDTPKKDKYLKDLKYERFYAGKISSEDFEFDIFAYEFSDEESAKKYYDNVTGVDIERNPAYLSSWGSFSGKLVVIHGKNAYILHTSTNNRNQVLDFIHEIFTVKIEV